MSAVRRSFVFSAADRYFTQVTTIATMMVMSRLLTPAETGLYLTAFAVILLAENIRDFGVTTYLVQERELSRPMIRCAFTINFLLSMAIGSAIWFSAGSIADYYGEPDLQDLLLVGCLVFVIVPLGSPIAALLRRELAFGTLAILNVAMAITVAATTVSFGLAGAGAVIYLWGYVAGASVMAVLCVAVRPQLWIYLPTFSGARKILSFGSLSSAITAVNLAYDIFPRLMLGRILGLDAVGLFGRALTVVQLPDRAIVQALNPVVLPAFAAQARAGADLAQSYLRGISFMTAVQWPALILVAFLADPLVHIVLGPQWGEVPDLVRMIALAHLALAPAFLTYPVLVAVGRLRDALFGSLISLPPSVALQLLVAPWGLEWVAASALLTAPMQMLVSFYFVRRALGLRWAEIGRAACPSLPVAVGTSAIPLCVIALSSTGFALDWAQTVIVLLGGALGWLIAMKLVDHPLRGELSAAWQLVFRRASVAPSGRPTA